MCHTILIKNKFVKVKDCLQIIYRKKERATCGEVFSIYNSTSYNWGLKRLNNLSELS